VYGAWTQFTRWVRCPVLRLPRDKKASRVLETFNQSIHPSSGDALWVTGVKVKVSALIFICKHARAPHCRKEALGLGNVACTYCKTVHILQDRVPYYVKRPLMMWRLNFFNPSPGERGGTGCCWSSSAVVVCVQCSPAGENSQAATANPHSPVGVLASVNWLDSACTSHYLFPLSSLSLARAHWWILLLLSNLNI